MRLLALGPLQPVGLDLLLDQTEDQVAERLQRHLALVALALCADRHQILGLLLLADDQQVGDALELVVADLASDLLVA